MLEQSSKQLFNAINDPILVHDLETGAILDVNDTMLEVFGYTFEEALGLDVEAISEGASPYSQREALHWMRLAAAGQPQVFDWRTRTKGGQVFWVEVSMRRALVDGRERLLVALRDIDKRKLAEQALLERDELFRLLFERAGDGNLLIEGNLFVDCNEVAVHLLGAQDKREVLNTHPSALSPEYQPDGRSSEEKADELIATCFRNGSHRFEWTHRRLDGTLFPVEVTLTSIPWQGKQIIHTTWRDLTEREQAERQRRSLEAQIQQAQKLESLGVLAGGIAHDFNNLLTAILGNLNLAQDRISPESPAAAFLDNAERTVLKASTLTQQLLAYSGKGHFVVRRHDLNEIVQEMTHLLKVSISKNAALDLQLGGNLPGFQADGAQFQQVIMNLVTNASDALEGRAGLIHIATGVVALDAPTIARDFPNQSLEPGTHVTLEVTDTGCGMNPEVLSRIFDPFFTTKTTGRGLGLSAMLGILRGHHAGLRIQSEVGRGTTFTVLFPAAGQP